MKRFDISTTIPCTSLVTNQLNLVIICYNISVSLINIHQQGSTWIDWSLLNGVGHAFYFELPPARHSPHPPIVTVSAVWNLFGESLQWIESIHGGFLKWYPKSPWLSMLSHGLKCYVFRIPFKGYHHVETETPSHGKLWKWMTIPKHRWNWSDEIDLSKPSFWWSNWIK
jgi:hypothetical protein